MDLFSFSRMAAIFEKYSGHFLKGAEMALILSLITVCCATVFGTLFALCKMSKIKPLKWIVSAYIEVFRSTPLMVQVMIIYFGAAALGWKIQFPFMKDFNSFFWGLLVLILNSSAYVAEIVRSGINAVDQGQAEAARSLGMSQTLTLKMVVLPQAFRNILPALMNRVRRHHQGDLHRFPGWHQRADVLCKGRHLHLLPDAGALCHRSDPVFYYGVSAVQAGFLCREEDERKCHTIR